MNAMRISITVQSTMLAVAALLAGAVQSPTPTTMHAHFFERGGTSIRYWEMGAGEPLVLIHGLFGSADAWRELAPLDGLARQWRVIAIDLRGNGASTKYRDPGRYGRALAEDVIGLLDHLGITRAHVLGYSYGSLVAMALLADHPERLDSVILGGASRIRPGVDEDVAWADSFADALEGPDAAAWLAGALASGDPEQDAAQRALIERRVRAADLPASAALLRSTAELAVSDETLRDNTTPILALVGELDPNHAEVVQMAAITRRMSVETIPGADHARAPRTPEFWQIVRDWLRRQRP